MHNVSDVVWCCVVLCDHLGMLRDKVVSPVSAAPQQFERPAFFDISQKLFQPHEASSCKREICRIIVLQWRHCM